MPWQTLPLVLSMVAGGYGPCQPDSALTNAQFRLHCSPEGITSLKRVGDRYDTDYIAPGAALGSLVVRYRLAQADNWAELPAQVQQCGRTSNSVSYRMGDTNLTATDTFLLERGCLEWRVQLRNLTGVQIEIGDLGVPLRLNSAFGRDKVDTYTRRVIRHSFIGEDGSFLYWMRTNGEGPFLLMLPGAGAGFEYFDFSRQNGYTPYVCSKASGDALRAKGGTWRLAHTSVNLGPKGSHSFEFRFFWASGHSDVRTLLYEKGLADVAVVPGMTVPTNLPTMVALRTKRSVSSVEPEFPGPTSVTTDVTKPGSRHGYKVYRVSFRRLGENMLKVRFSDGRLLTLEFFVTEPLDTLFKKRSAFIVAHEQHRDPSKWYNGLFSQWDMKNHKLRSPDDLDGLQSYAVACDDPILGKAAYVAGKNIFYPNAKEIGAVEYYLEHYVWGGLQETDKEQYPFAIYGIPNWKVLRDSPVDTDKGKRHVWRIYDYPHVILTYYDMYRVARVYPKLVHYLSAEGYLERAFGTAQAFFTVPEEVERWSPYDTGTYDELILPELIDDLQSEGHQDQARELRALWEKKVETFVNDRPYLYGSEYAFDTTGFESTQAIAAYALRHAADSDPSSATFRHAVSRSVADSFMEFQNRLNIACRGSIEPAYYDLGSDYRGGGNTNYTLSYMSQMGGWAICDHALYFSNDPAQEMRLGYASFLSSWALLNSGNAASNYGYWYPGQENDGGASGGFEPRPWGVAWLGRKVMGRGPWWYSGEIDLGFGGALRTAATVVTDDSIFGPYAYGGVLSHFGQTFEVLPRDGLRVRFHAMFGHTKLHVLLKRDGFAKEKPITFNRNLSSLEFTVENRGGGPHDVVAEIEGLPKGKYRIYAGANPAVVVRTAGPGPQQLAFPMQGSAVFVRLRRMS